MLTGREFFNVYAGYGAKVLDVGSLDVNGSLRTWMPPGADYIGCDLVAGPGVDVVLGDPYCFPWRSGTFDLVVSTSCFEHTEFFWETFAEMARVARVGGFIYVSAPVQGEVHRHPVDCWRFYPDAGRALASWATRTGSPVDLLESFWMPPVQDQWVDYVAIWGKSPFVFPGRRVSSRFPQAKHVLSE